jgi:hypothetical protein
MAGMTILMGRPLMRRKHRRHRLNPGYRFDRRLAGLPQGLGPRPTVRRNFQGKAHGIAAGNRPHHQPRNHVLLHDAAAADRVNHLVQGPENVFAADAHGALIIADGFQTNLFAALPGINIKRDLPISPYLRPRENAILTAESRQPSSP